MLADFCSHHENHFAYAKSHLKIEIPVWFRSKWLSFVQIWYMFQFAKFWKTEKAISFSLLAFLVRSQLWLKTLDSYSKLNENHENKLCWGFAILSDIITRNTVTVLNRYAQQLCKIHKLFSEQISVVVQKSKFLYVVGNTQWGIWCGFIHSVCCIGTFTRQKIRGWHI